MRLLAKSRLLALLAVALAFHVQDFVRAAEPPAWKEATIPDHWKGAPAGKDGRLWYRCKVAIPATWRSRKLELVVEAVDDAREVYFGGKSIGMLGSFPPEYRSGLGETQRLTIPGEAIRFGSENLVAIRVCNIAGPQRLQRRRAGALCRRCGDSPGRQMGNGQTATTWPGPQPTLHRRQRARLHQDRRSRPSSSAS